MEQNFQNTAQRLKALSDPKRLRIVNMLSCGELCACKILEAFHITQPTLSHDMKLLQAAGLVVGRRDGRWMYYALNTLAVEELQRDLGNLMVPDPNCICHNFER